MQTLPSLAHYLLRNSEQFSTRAAMRHKGLGIWKEWNWAGVCSEVQRFVIGLKDLGIKAGNNEHIFIYIRIVRARDASRRCFEYGHEFVPIRKNCRITTQ